MMTIIFIKLTKSRVKDKNYATIRIQCFRSGTCFLPAGPGDTATVSRTQTSAVAALNPGSRHCTQALGGQGAGYKLTPVSPRRTPWEPHGLQTERADGSCRASRAAVASQWPTRSERLATTDPERLAFSRERGRI